MLLDLFQLVYHSYFSVCHQVYSFHFLEIRDKNIQGPHLIAVYSLGQVSESVMLFLFYILGGSQF